VLAPNTINAGIHKSLEEQVGTGRGGVMIPESSLFIIKRDPFRSIRRGRQLFQRKFTRSQGFGTRINDGVGNFDQIPALGAGLVDSCAGCHGRPHGAAGFGGNVVTRPDSRDAPHLFGLGLVEMIGDEITSELRATRDAARDQARDAGQSVTVDLFGKGINYGRITARPDGSVDTSEVKGVDADLRVRPFFAEGLVFAMREFIVGAFKDEMGIEAVDPDLLAASGGGSATTPSGLVLNGAIDRVGPPPVADATEDADGDGVANEAPTSVVDHIEFYLLNYFKPGRYLQSKVSRQGRAIFDRIGCAECHIPDLTIVNDRRVADVETNFDPARDGLNGLFATAEPRLVEASDGSAHASLKTPAGGSFVVRDIYADFKRHDLGPAFHERNYDGSTTTEFMTEPLWGVGSSAPYGHDGRSINLREVIIRHGGEATDSRTAFTRLPAIKQRALLEFLRTLVLFPPDDTASNLNPADPTVPGFPQSGHGSINLGALFNDPTDGE